MLTTMARGFLGINLLYLHTIKSLLLGICSALAYGTVISLLNPLKLTNAISFDAHLFITSLNALDSFSDSV